MSVFHTFRCKCFKVERGKIKKFAFRITQCIYLRPAVGRDEYRLYNETIKYMINNHNVVFCENNFKVSNKHTIAISSYVRLDTVFVNNSTSTQPDNIKDDLTNWISSSE
jgi:hypothetical protein